MQTASYTSRRSELEVYFDHTAAEAWAKLTSEAPVSGIRATVRAGRDAMRDTLLSWLPQNLEGRRILDAGCGAGQLALELARRGAEVVAIDLAETLVRLAEERQHGMDLRGRVEFRVGDMTDSGLGRLDQIVAMDSLIHYRAHDLLACLTHLADRVEESLLFTFAPRTPLLATMHAVGKLFPKSDRSPAIEPISQGLLARRLDSDLAADRQRGRTLRINSTFYISQAQEVVAR